MADLITMLSAVAGQQGEEVDEDFNQTVLLLHGDGTNGAQNNTFLDSSTNNFTITRNGNTTQGTFSPFSVGAGEWSNYFDGTDDRLSVANNAAFDFGTGNFTIECWFYLVADATATTGGTRGANIISVIPSSGTVNGYALYLTGNSTTTGTGIVFENTVSNTGYFATYTATISKNTWHHVAVARSGTTTKLFFNGAEVVSTTLGNQTVSNYSNATNIGASTYTGYTSNFPGYLSNVRVVKGRAVYTSAFTPSTVPLGATSGGTNPPQGTETSLLTCQSNRFVDNGGLVTPNTITRNGDVRVTPFSPFAPTAAYSAGTNGGSGYWDGTGDYLMTPSNSAFEFGIGDWTIEFFAYFNTVSGASGHILYDGRPTVLSPTIYVIGSVLYYYTNSANRITGPTLVPNQWYHIVVSRNSGSTRLFVNGVQQGSTYSDSNNYSSSAVGIGVDTNAVNPNNFNGYFSSFRVLKGTGYSSVTVPTAPLTNITNTSLLLNFTNAGIFDQTGKNNLETVGNAQIDTTTKKYGTGSMKFDGSGDELIASEELARLGTGDFTVECWWKVNVSSGDYQTIIEKGIVTGTPVNGSWSFGTRTNTTVAAWFAYYNSGFVDVTGTGNANDGNWHHLAVTREGTSLRLFSDGTLLTTHTLPSNFSFGTGNTLATRIGYNQRNNRYINGYIDDLRITKGVARYTANFTAPTKAFPDQ